MQEEPEKVDKLLHIALAQFSQILAKGEEHNLFAAHGAAAVLAEQATRAHPAKLDYLIPAKKIFDKVFPSTFSLLCLFKVIRDLSVEVSAICMSLL